MNNYKGFKNLTINKLIAFSFRNHFINKTSESVYRKTIEYFKRVILDEYKNLRFML